MSHFPTPVESRTGEAIEPVTALYRKRSSTKGGGKELPRPAAPKHECPVSTPRAADDLIELCDYATGNNGAERLL
jgi:hypothetical protein